MYHYEYEVYHNRELFTFNTDSEALDCARALTKDNDENNIAYIVRRRSSTSKYEIYSLTWCFDDIFLFEVLM